MPKTKPVKSFKLNKFVREFGEDTFSTDGMILFCKVCQVKVASEKRFTITQHIERDKHKRGLEAAKNKAQSSQQLLNQCQSSTSKKTSFHRDMCETLIAANIPFEKLNNSKFRSFLEIHTGHSIPDESTLRKNYMQDCFNETMDKIRNFVKDKKLYIVIDETMDVESRPVANVMVGTLEPGNSGKIFLLNSEVLEKVNHSTICQLFDRSLNLLWPNGVEYSNVLLFLSDAAPYMVKAGKAIKSFYPKLVHVTCLAHAMHRISEEIRSHFPEVDRLVSNVKKFFVKSPSRVEVFKSQAPDLALPPKPVITRWGTWLDACIYYSENFQIVKSIVNSFQQEDAAFIRITQQIFFQKEVEGQLAFIRSNFSVLTSTIQGLQKRDMVLSDAIQLVDDLSDLLKNVKDHIGQCVFNKLNSVLQKNVGFLTLKKISDVLTGKEESFDVEEELTISDSVFFKYAPITSVDVERSFSRYKNILSDNRRSFTFDSIKKYLIVHCNAEITD